MIARTLKPPSETSDGGRGENFMISHVVALLRLAGLVSVISGLIGGYVWLFAILDRSDGDALRLGVFHNPFMQFPPFNETFLDLSMPVLFACSAAVGIGGLMLLVPSKWGVPLVMWQARVSIITNGVTAFFILASMFVFAKNQRDVWHLGGTPEALALRLGSLAVDLMLWTFLGSNAVREFCRQQPAHRAGHAFDVIIKESTGIN